MLRYVLLCLLFATSAFAFPPTHFGVGLNLQVPTGDFSSSSNLWVPGSQPGWGLDLEFGQLITPKLGYTVGLHGTLFFVDDYDNFAGPFLTEGHALRLDAKHSSISLGGTYLLSGINVDLFAKIHWGQVKIQRDRTDIIYRDPDGNIISWTGGLETIYQNGLVGFEIGAKKHLTGGLWGQISYSYTPLRNITYVDSYGEEMKVNSVQYVGVGLAYKWEPIRK
jgi:hypothetical protein